MPTRRVLLLGEGDLADETAAALEAAGAEVRRLEDPAQDELRGALGEPLDSVTIVSREDGWPLRTALLVRHLDEDVPIVVTIFDQPAGAQLEREIGRCTITALADIVAPVLAGPCVDEDLTALTVKDGRPVGLSSRGGEVSGAPLPSPRPRRVRALAWALAKPFDHSAALVFFGAVGLVFVLILETVSAAVVLDQHIVDAFYGAVKTLVTVDPNPAVQDGPKWFKVFVSATMLVALLFAAAFTGGLVERLVGRNLTGLLGRRAVPRSDHVIVVGLGQVGLRLCQLLRRAGYSVVAVDDREGGENVGHARALGLPVVIGRGADPSLLERLSLQRAMALAIVTADDLVNIRVALAAREHAPDLRLVLRAGSNEAGGETRSLRRLGHVRDVHRIGAVAIAGAALGGPPSEVVVEGDVARLRDGDGALTECPYPVAG